MAIIPALSVQYSNAGTNVFQLFFLPVSSNAFRKPLFAETPPAMQISFIPVSIDAFLSLLSRIETILCCTEAQRSARFSFINTSLSFSVF
jgi:hypothetical protein